MGRLQEITDFFDVVRQKSDNIRASVDKCLADYKDLSKFSWCRELPKEGFAEFLSTVLAGCNFLLNEEQEKKILAELSANSLNGEIDKAIWGALFRYWLRKDKSPVSAFVAVDVQNDFITGSLALHNCPGKQEGEEVVSIINEIKKAYSFDYFFYTLDWHPPEHSSFITNVGKYKLHASSPKSAEDAKVYDLVIYEGGNGREQIMWPPHCIQGTHGSELHRDLKVNEKDIKIYKGTKSNIDSYSAFWDNGHLSQTNLLVELLERGASQVFIGGLATDFCVAYTALDAVEHGFDTFVVEEACRGVADESIANMRAQMIEAGVKIISISQIKEHIGK